MANNGFHTVRGYQLLEQSKGQLTPAMEDYLEMIYRGGIKEGYVRINTLADMLNVRPASASKMVQKLNAIGLLIYKKFGIIQLNESGREIGEYLLKRHQIIENLLKHIGCENNLLQEIELIEHNMAPITVHKINILNNFFSENTDVFERFQEYRGVKDLDNEI